MSMEATSGTKAEQPVAKRRGLLSRFVRNREGTTAIEFTALAIPFALLVFAILESCVSFAAQQLLANATDDVARQVRTGELLAANLNETTMHTAICAQMQILAGAGCPGLEVDLEQYTTFADAAQVRTKYTANHDLDTTGFDVKPGPAMSKNMLRVYYRWPIMTDFLRKSMSNLPGNKTLLFATVTWQNEPF